MAYTLTVNRLSRYILLGQPVYYICFYNDYCGFVDLRFSMGIRGIVTKSRGVPLRFFMRTPRKAPIVAIINVSKTNVF